MLRGFIYSHFYPQKRFLTLLSVWFGKSVLLKKTIHKSEPQFAIRILPIFLKRQPIASGTYRKLIFHFAEFWPPRADADQRFSCGSIPTTAWCWVRAPKTPNDWRAKRWKIDIRPQYTQIARGATYVECMRAVCSERGPSIRARKNAYKSQPLAHNIKCAFTLSITLHHNV